MKFKPFAVQINNLTLWDSGQVFSSDATLLSRISLMPPGIKISLCTAYNLYVQEIVAPISDSSSEIEWEYLLGKRHWTEFVASCGYQILLKGDEFEEDAA